MSARPITRNQTKRPLASLHSHHEDMLLTSMSTSLGFRIDRFAILVIPSYVESAELGAAPSASNRDEPVSAEAAARSSPFIAPTTTGDKSWVWFSTMNRVQSQVLKTLVLAYVTVPRTTDAVLSADLADPQRFVQRLKEGGLYSVREIAIRRWVPARMRA